MTSWEILSTLFIRKRRRRSIRLAQLATRLSDDGSVADVLWQHVSAPITWLGRALDDDHFEMADDDNDEGVVTTTTTPPPVDGESLSKEAAQALRRRERRLRRRRRSMANRMAPRIALEVERSLTTWERTDALLGPLMALEQHANAILSRPRSPTA